MPVKLKTIKQQTRVLPPIMFGEDSLNVEYFINVYTPRFEEESQRRRLSGVESTAGEALGMMVVPLIAKWDLSDDYEVGTMVDVVQPMVNVGSEDAPQYVSPEINGWKFYFMDSSTGKLTEAPREQIVYVNSDDGRCTIRQFEPKIEDDEPVVAETIVPVTVTGLSNVPMIVMTELLKKIGEALTPGEEKSFSSGESSFTDDQ